MKTLSFIRQSPLPTEMQIAEFESRHGFKLPHDYRQFLLQQGGGLVGDSNRIFCTPGGEDGLPVETLFAAVGEGIRLLDKELELYLSRDWQTGDPADHTIHRMPREFIPVGDTCFGDYFCVGLSTPVLGQVFFWSHDRAGVPGIDPDPRYEDFFFLAGDFGTFIGLLTSAE